MSKKRKLYLGINLQNDPSVAIVENGKVIAFSEEERHIRLKHAPNYYPIQALKSCLEIANCQFEDITKLAVNWNLTAYNNGTMESFYSKLRDQYDVDEFTKKWQENNLKKRSWDNFKDFHIKKLTKFFGNVDLPEIVDYPHHYIHAYQSFIESGFKEAISISIDGSGDQNCTTIWHCIGDEINCIKEINMPNSLGWLYSAFTEFLGFEAYDGEYKVMGLAAYGEENLQIKSALEQICSISSDGIGYVIDPKYIHYGKHTYSNRFTDDLIKLLGKNPRKTNEEIENWHKDLAFEVQTLLEKTILRLIKWAIKETGLNKICIGGGVGLNVKLNSRIFKLEEVSDVFAHPLCSDTGAAAGAALTACYKENGIRPLKLKSLALGFKEKAEDIEKLLNITKVKYTKSNNVSEEVSEYLSQGLIVGWFQGRMEAGPRALGQRSILANPTKEIYRDKVNLIVKFREDWRPFCPSMLEEYCREYFKKTTYAPFMIIAFEAENKLKDDAPAIVHIDGTSRVQLVYKETNPKYHALIESFRKKTGVPILLNTSFNVKGEPIVCTAKDALRTFWTTALDVLVLDDFIIKKPII